MANPDFKNLKNLKNPQHLPLTATSMCGVESNNNNIVCYPKEIFNNSKQIILTFGNRENIMLTFKMFNIAYIFQERVCWL